MSNEQDPNEAVADISNSNTEDEDDDDDDTPETQSFRPALSPATVTQLTRDLYGLRVRKCRELDSYDDRNFLVEVDTERGVEVDSGHVDHNDHLPAQLCPHGYVLKVLNSQDSRKPEVIEAKNAMMVAAVKQGFPTPRPVPSLSGQLSCLQLLTREQPPDQLATAGEVLVERKDVYLIRLMEFLPGTILASVTLTPDLSFQVGQYAAKLDLALKDFDDSQCPELVVDWNMQNVPSLRHLLRFIDDAEKADVVRQVIEAFESKVLTRRSGLQTGIIHSDFNDHNILVQPDESEPSSSPLSASSSPTMHVSGILDFGDATKSFLLIEIAIAMNYLTLLCPSDVNPDEMSGHALAGYLSEIELSREEVELIPLAMCARFSQTLTYGFQRRVLDPGNAYCLVHADKAWPHMQRLWTRPLQDTVAIWRGISQSHGVTFPA